MVGAVEETDGCGALASVVTHAGRNGEFVISVKFQRMESCKGSGVGTQFTDAGIQIAEFLLHGGKDFIKSGDIISRAVFFTYFPSSLTLVSS